jgi:hypothetical protein
MNTKRWWNQFIAPATMLALLFSSYLIVLWHESLKDIFSTTFDFHYMNLRLWSVPLLSVLFAIVGLMLFRYLTSHKNRYTSILFLCVGLFIVFYPPIVVSFGLLSVLRIPVDYFGNSNFYFIGATIAGIGFLELIFPRE